MTQKIRVVIVDDHPVVRAGIRKLLEGNSDIEVVGEGDAGNHVLEMLEEHTPDVLITDLWMPAHEDNPNGMLFEPISTLRKAIEMHPQTGFIVLSQEDDIQTIQSLAEIGVRGYLLKTDAFARLLDRAVEMIHIGGTYFSPEVSEAIYRAPRLHNDDVLTPRQLEVLRAIANNTEAPRGEIARTLHISYNTLQKHIAAIYEALDVPNMESCLIKAMRMRLVNVEDILD